MKYNAFLNGLYCNFINVPLRTVFANPVTYAERNSIRAYVCITPSLNLLPLSPLILITQYTTDMMITIKSISPSIPPTTPPTIAPVLSSSVDASVVLSIKVHAYAMYVYNYVCNNVRMCLFQSNGIN